MLYDAYVQCAYAVNLYQQQENRSFYIIETSIFFLALFYKYISVSKCQLAVMSLHLEQELSKHMGCNTRAMRTTTYSVDPCLLGGLFRVRYNYLLTRLLTELLAIIFY